MKLTLSATLGAGHLREKCDGNTRALAAAAITDRGHQPARSAGEIPVLFCVRCGSFAARRAYGLAATCPGRPTPAGKQALARTKAGKQPWCDRGAGVYRRLISDRPMAWDADREAFVDLGPLRRPTRRRAGARDVDGAPADSGEGNSDQPERSMATEPSAMQLDATDDTMGTNCLTANADAHVADDDDGDQTRDSGERVEKDLR